MSQIGYQSGTANREILELGQLPPDLETYATDPGRYNLEAKMLSSIPPVLPILKAPGLIPPTVAGPTNSIRRHNGVS